MNTFVKVTLSSPRVEDSDDVQKVMEIAKNIGYTCREEEISGENAPLELNKLLQKLTGQQLEVCDLLIGSKKPLKTMNEWYQDYKHKYIEERAESEHEYIIRSIIVHRYAHLLEVPNIESVRAGLQRQCGREYSAHAVKRLLKLNGYHWKNLRGTTKSIIVEDLDKSYERQKYLRSIIQYRQSNRHIVYIYEIIIKPDRDIIPDVLKTCFYAAVSPQHGVLDFSFIENTPNPGVKIEQLIISNVISELPPASVLVLPTRSYHDKGTHSLPTMHSSKLSMTAWLDHHNVPYHPEMHRAELYALILRSKHNSVDELHKVDAVLATYGHSTLWLPRNNTYLYFFEYFMSNLFKDIGELTTDSKQQILEAVQGISLEEWKMMENTLISKENKTYKEDVVMEEIIDKIVILSRDRRLTPEDLQDCDELDTDDWLSEVILP